MKKILKFIGLLIEGAFEFFPFLLMLCFPVWVVLWVVKFATGSEWLGTVLAKGNFDGAIAFGMPLVGFFLLFVWWLEILRKPLRPLFHLVGLDLMVGKPLFSKKTELPPLWQSIANAAASSGVTLAYVDEYDHSKILKNTVILEYSASHFVIEPVDRAAADAWVREAKHIENRLRRVLYYVEELKIGWTREDHIRIDVILPASFNAAAGRRPSDANS